MTSFGSPDGNVLYLIVCAAKPALDTADYVTKKQDEGYCVSVIATPEALKWLDIPAVEKASAFPIRSEFRKHNEPRFEPLGDEIIVQPATFNTINKWAAGISDTLALGLLNEALGSEIPITCHLTVGSQLASHPAMKKNMRLLEKAGVVIRRPGLPESGPSDH